MPQKPILAPAPGQFRDFILSRTGRQLGIFKTAAVKARIPFDEYIRRLDAGLKRCATCREWRSCDQFGPDSTRWDGRDAHCYDCHRGFSRERYVPIPLEKQKPKGPPRHDPRDGDKLQARQLINVDVKRGRRPDPDDLHCALCGHKGGARRHEYHHHMGYLARHHYDVIPLCSKCHSKEHA